MQQESCRRAAGELQESIVLPFLIAAVERPATQMLS